MNRFKGVQYAKVQSRYGGSSNNKTRPRCTHLSIMLSRAASSDSSRSAGHSRNPWKANTEKIAGSDAATAKQIQFHPTADDNELANAQVVSGTQRATYGWLDGGSPFAFKRHCTISAHF